MIFMKRPDVLAAKRLQVMKEQFLISCEAIYGPAMVPFEGFVNGDCKEMSADTFIFLLAKIMFVIVRCCTRPMDKRGISIIIVPDTD